MRLAIAELSVQRNLLSLGPLGPGTNTELGSGAACIVCDLGWTQCSVEVYYFGLSGRARILNWVQVPVRFVWR